MRHLVVLGGVLAALALAPAASSGGFASVGFAPLPDGTAAGSMWSPKIYVKQHAIRPLRGLQPVVEIYDDRGGARRILARETPEAGVYEADVVFPSAGNWSVTIHSGFVDGHVTYGPFSVEAPFVVGGDSGELPVVGIALAIAIGSLLACLALFARRARSLSPAG